MPTNTLPPRFERQVKSSLMKQLGNSAEVERIVAKWKAGILPAPCTEENKGKEVGLHTGCMCEGCRERTGMMFLQTASALGVRDGHAA